MRNRVWVAMAEIICQSKRKTGAGYKKLWSKLEPGAGSPAPGEKWLDKPRQETCHVFSNEPKPS